MQRAIDHRDAPYPCFSAEKEGTYRFSKTTLYPSGPTCLHFFYLLLPFASSCKGGAFRTLVHAKEKSFW